MPKTKRCLCDNFWISSSCPPMHSSNCCEYVPAALAAKRRSKQNKISNEDIHISANSRIES